MAIGIVGGRDVSCCGGRCDGHGVWLWRLGRRRGVVRGLAGGVSVGEIERRGHCWVQQGELGCVAVSSMGQDVQMTIMRGAVASKGAATKFAPRAEHELRVVSQHLCVGFDGQSAVFSAGHVVFPCVIAPVAWVAMRRVA